ncbi:D-alanine-D-alanine ligase [Motilibacter peucedani]|uniref:D-alanine--D-alanine ligase n=1 Tax=Motilibacter peucedani TaxID=598650 RepID=A0A420XUM1_9ACTN|nr:D-alanine-D-alanine ligase [Motilibacter peucedani]
MTVIGGGANCEHEVGLASAASVAAALDHDRYVVDCLTIAPDGRWLGSDGSPLASGMAGALDRLAHTDVVFPAVHGPRGEDGTLAALCVLAAVPFVGSGVRSGALAMDKWATKLVAEAVGVRTAGGALVRAGDAPQVELPVVVKPVEAGSSFGVSLVEHAEQLAPALAAALALDDRVLVEPVVHGREVDVAVLRRADGSLLVGPPLEIEVAPGGLFDTTAKYDGSARFVIPAHLSPAELECLTTAATAVFEALGCEGVARVDFFLTADGPVLNEVNTMPGMTRHSQVPRIFAAAGVDYPDLLDLLVSAALARAA